MTEDNGEKRADDATDRTAGVASLNVALPVFPANGLRTAVSLSDATLTFQLNDQPVAAIFVSMPMAKSIAELLLQNVAEYERATGQTVRSLLELGAEAKRAP